MRYVRLTALLLGMVVCAGCFQMTTVLKIRADGSGTIEHRMLFTAQALAQLRQLAAFGGGGQPFDPLSERQAREMAAVIGPGVAYVSSTPVTTPLGQGRESTYAFTDVGQLKIATQPAAPGGVTVRAQGLSTEGETITFSLTREPNGNAVLHINVPEPNWFDALGSGKASNQMSTIKAMLAGAHILLAVEPEGAVARTSSPYADGQRVTLLEVDLDQVLKDETLLARLQAATTPQELKAIVKDAAGLKINFDREITIEFTPGAK